MSVVVGADKYWNLSAVRNPIELKLGGDLWLVSQISMHALVLRLSCLNFVNKKPRKSQKSWFLENLSFLRYSKSD
jgi:hypothetical protein